MNTTMKRQFRIGQLAKDLAVERFVIRFWEKEFGVKPVRSKGGQRFYQEKDAKTFAKIKTLLYDQGFTIAGAKKILQEDAITLVGSQHLRTPGKHSLTPDIQDKLKRLRQQLVRLREQL